MESLTVVPTVFIQLIGLRIQNMPEGWIRLTIYMDFPRIDANYRTYVLIRSNHQRAFISKTLRTYRIGHASREF